MANDRCIVEFMNRSDRAASKAEKWREMILQQQNSGLRVEAFCEQQGVSSWSFYQWRKRLGMTDSVRFALVETGGESQQQSSTAVEVWLNGGDRLHVWPGVDAATLRTVLSVLRERQ
jgi:predicted exporter